MKVIRSAKLLHAAIQKLKSQRKKIGFVPTMGFLHEGHLSLLRRSHKENNITVLSIFVNPTQFGPKEDFKKYPRNLRKDKLFAKKEKVDILFLPSADEMYPQGYKTYVEVGEMAKGLCGPFRPGHFKGVATVVAKLLNIVSCDVMYLGQKDAQQAAILRKMVSDLNFPVTVKVLPTIREKDGLAMSSRNSYLNSKERRVAPVLYRALLKGKSLIHEGERSSAKVVSSIKKMIGASKAFRIDYVECRDAETLSDLKTLKGNVLIALAAWLGKTRLIDNVVVIVK